MQHREGLGFGLDRLWIDRLSQREGEFTSLRQGAGKVQSALKVGIAQGFDQVEEAATHRSRQRGRRQMPFPRELQGLGVKLQRFVGAQAGQQGANGRVTVTPRDQLLGRRESSPPRFLPDRLGGQIVLGGEALRVIQPAGGQSRLTLGLAE